MTVRLSEIMSIMVLYQNWIIGKKNNNNNWTLITAPPLIDTRKDPAGNHICQNK